MENCKSLYIRNGRFTSNIVGINKTWLYQKVFEKNWYCLALNIVLFLKKYDHRQCTKYPKYFSARQWRLGSSHSWTVVHSIWEITCLIQHSSLLLNLNSFYKNNFTKNKILPLKSSHWKVDFSGGIPWNLIDTLRWQWFSLIIITHWQINVMPLSVNGKSQLFTIELTPLKKVCWADCGHTLVSFKAEAASKIFSFVN